jgi:hypothetical protein
VRHLVSTTLFGAGIAGARPLARGIVGWDIAGWGIARSRIAGSGIAGIAALVVRVGTHDAGETWPADTS